MMPLIVYGMAAWRVASMLVSESGPWDIFLKLRERAGIIHDDEGKALVIPDGFFPGIFSCIWCCSVWVGTFWMLFDLFYPWLALRIATAFAFSTVAILIQCFVDRTR